MKKLNKWILILFVIIVAIVIYFYPRSFKQTCENVQIFENGNKINTTTVNVDGKIHRGRFVWQRLKFSQELYGTVTIDDKIYNMSPVDLYEFPDEDGNHTDHGIFSSLLSVEPEDIVNDKFLSLNITHDKSKLYINTFSPDSSTELIYPFNSDEDYKKVKDRMQP